MKKDRRININDIRGFKTQLIFLTYLIFYLYLTFKYWSELSFNTGLCESCGGIFGVIKNPVPGIFFAILFFGTTAILPKVFKSDYWEYHIQGIKGLNITELNFKNGDRYVGQITKIKKEYALHGKGYYVKKNDKKIKDGYWYANNFVTKKTFLAANKKKILAKEKEMEKI